MDVKKLCDQFLVLAKINLAPILPVDTHTREQAFLDKNKQEEQKKKDKAKQLAKQEEQKKKDEAKQLAKQKEEQEKLLKTRNTKESAEERAKKNNWTIIPLQKTPMTTLGTFSAVKNFVQNYLGIKENVDTVTEILLGQLVVETGLHAAHNYNVGNIMAHDKPNEFWKGKVIILHAHEFTKQKEKYWLYSLFRAYDNLNDGIGDWLLFLKKRIPSAIEKAKQGDVAGFVLALKAGGYYTAPVEDYMKGVKAGIRMVQSKMKKERAAMA